MSRSLQTPSRMQHLSLLLAGPLEKVCCTVGSTLSLDMCLSFIILSIFWCKCYPFWSNGHISALSGFTLISIFVIFALHWFLGLTFIKGNIFRPLLNFCIIYVILKFDPCIQNDSTLYGCFHSNEICINKLNLSTAEQTLKLHWKCRLESFTQTL